MTDPYFKPLKAATVHWQNQQPLSDVYQDVYFSKDNGLEETEYVFIQSNQLQLRWQQLQGNDFCIAETGFGTGLNFLASLKFWLTQTSSGTLHFISAEKYPLTFEDLRQSLNHWPDIEPLTNRLLDSYPPPLPGMHRLQFPDLRCTLTLLYGDAGSLFNALQSPSEKARVDAWFLDGFAPAKNPDMWTPALFNTLARLSHQNTTLSTFTAASLVRTGLTQAGFRVEKIPGFGRKRHMLTATYQDENEVNNSQESIFPRWFIPKSPLPETRTAVVIGTGIAGCATAAALARRGIKVTLIDQHPEPAFEASGNPQAIIYPKLSLRMGNLSRFSLAALSYSLDFYRSFWHDENQGKFGERTGLVLLPENKQQINDYQKIAELYPNNLVQLISKEGLAEKTGLSLAAENALYFPQLGWINPSAVCQHLIDHPLVEFRQASVSELMQSGTGWQLTDSHQALIAKADTVIIACGQGSKLFQQSSHLPLKPVGGQVSFMPATPESCHLKTILCGHGYLAPAHNGYHSLGASYRLGTTNLSVTRQDHLGNIELLGKTDHQLANLFANSEVSELDGRTAYRCTTPDYLPVAGLAPIFDDFLKDFAELRNNGRRVINTPGSYYPNLYLNCGHGSRGMSYAPLCAEIIASQIGNQFAPVEPELLKAIHPTRFITRNLKRKHL